MAVPVYGMVLTPNYVLICYREEWRPLHDGKSHNFSNTPEFRAWDQAFREGLATVYNGKYLSDYRTIGLMLQSSFPCRRYTDAFVEAEDIEEDCCCRTSYQDLEEPSPY